MSRPGARVVVAGALAALLTFVPAVLTVDRVARMLDVSGESLARRGYVLVAIVGIAVLVGAVLAAALAGSWAAAGAMLAAVVQVGAAGPLVLAVYGAAYHRGFAVVAAGVGLAAGTAAALTRGRVLWAGGGIVVSALVLLLLTAATGGEPEKVIDQGAWVPAVLLLGLLVATVTCTVGVAAGAAARRGALPAALGPIALAMVSGGGAALTLAHQNDGEFESSYLNGVHHMGPSITLLLVAAVLVAGLAAAQAARPDPSPQPGRSQPPVVRG